MPENTGTAETDTSTSAIDSLVLKLEDAAEDDEMAFTRFGYAETADAVRELLRERDMLHKALDTAADELAACAEVIGDREASAQARVWARKAKGAAASVGFQH